MIVLTVDQRASRRSEDLVPELLGRLAQRWPLVTAGGVVRGFERTVGDEVQGVLDAPEVAVDLALWLVRVGGWSVGLGAGPVSHLPASPREGHGEAFVLAREAVEAAKSPRRPVSVAVRGHEPGVAAECEGVLVLLGAIGARRSEAGWAAIDGMVRTGGRQGEVAAGLGVSQQAVSERLRAALWAEERAARPAAARLLGAAAGAGGP